MVNKIVDVFYRNFFALEIDGHSVGVALSEDGTLYNIKPYCLRGKEAKENALGMSNEELDAFLQSQPDFAKRVATPLNAKDPPLDNAIECPIGGGARANFPSVICVVSMGCGQYATELGLPTIDVLAVARAS